VVYSPLEAVAMAEQMPDKEMVFLGVGFETTAPRLAMTVKRAAEKALANFSMLVAAKTIPEVMTHLATADDLALDGFLLPGHVSAIIGTEVYRPFAEEHGLACAVAGFEPLEMLDGIDHLVRQAGKRTYRVDNCYGSVVKRFGNPTAVSVMEEVFEPCTTTWRGIGAVGESGLRLRSAYAAFDAAQKFSVSLPAPREPEGCRCGDVLKGKIRPDECPLFGKRCTPSRPRGACMVSSEGACAAGFNYQILEEG
jgi:hydrogenase expression/formation protein HypD